MKPYIEFGDLSYDRIHSFAVNAVEQSQDEKFFDPLFLLGKAAGYLDVAMALEIITYAQAETLLGFIMEHEKRIFEARYMNFFPKL